MARRSRSRSRAAISGVANLDVGFAGPNGLGIEVDAVAVTGGGYLGLDPGKAEYAGALDLSIPAMVVKAYGLVQTRLPGGAAGLLVRRRDLGRVLAGGRASVRLLARRRRRAARRQPHDRGGCRASRRCGRTTSTGCCSRRTRSRAAPQLISALDTLLPGRATAATCSGRWRRSAGATGIVEGEVGAAARAARAAEAAADRRDRRSACRRSSPQLELHISFAGGIDFGKKLAFFDATLHDSQHRELPDQRRPRVPLRLGRRRRCSRSRSAASTRTSSRRPGSRRSSGSRSRSARASRRSRRRPTSR